MTWELQIGNRISYAVTLLGLVAFSFSAAFAQDAAPTETEKRLAALEQEYRAAYEREVGKAYGAQVTDLNGKYSAALEREMNTATKAGKLEEAVALRDEINRVKEGGPLPQAAPENSPESLKKLRGTYRQQIGKLNETRNQAAAPVIARFEKALEAYQNELTQAAKLDAALAVKAYRDKGAGTQLLGVAAIAAAAKPDPGKVVMPEKPQPGSPTKMGHEEAARILALWMLEANGSALLRVKGVERWFNPADALPERGDFEILRANRRTGQTFEPKTPFPWEACAALPELKRLAIGNVGLIEPEQIARLGAAKDLLLLELTGKSEFAPGAVESFPALPGLTELYLKGVPGLDSKAPRLFAVKFPNLRLAAWGNSETDWSAEAFSSLSEFKHLEEVQWIGRGKIGVELAEAAEQCSTLKSLSFYGAFTIDPAIIPQLDSIRRLTEFHIGSRGMLPNLAQLAAMKNLLTLKMSYSKVNDEGLQTIIQHAGPNLTELVLNPTDQLTDLGFKGIDRLKLTRLDCSRTGITDAGLAHLTGLKDLEELLLSGTTVTDAGVAALQKELPKCKISR